MNPRHWLSRLTLAFTLAGCERPPETALPLEPEATAAPETIPEAAPRAAYRKANRAGELPAWKRDYLTRKDDGIAAASFLDTLDDPAQKLSPAQKFVYREVFAAEGGHEMAPGGSAVGGIMNDTLKRLAADKSDEPFVRNLRRDVLEQALLTENTGTAALSPDLLPRLYTYDLSRRFKRLFPEITDPQEKVAAVLEGFKSPEIAAAVTDTVYRFGDAGGARSLAKALAAVDPQRGDEVGANPSLFGQKLHAAYVDLSADPDTRRSLLDYIAKSRGEAVDRQAARPKFAKYAKSLKAGEAKRSRNFRFTEGP